MNRRKFLSVVAVGASTGLVSMTEAKASTGSRVQAAAGAGPAKLDYDALARRFPVAATTTRGKRVFALTSDDAYCLHTYFDVDPIHPDGRRMLYFRTQREAKTGFVCQLDLVTGDELVLDEVGEFNLHVGPFMHWGPRGEKAYYSGTAPEGGIRCLRSADPATGKVEVYPEVPSGRVNPVTGEATFPSNDRHRVMRSNLDGSNKLELANMEEVLALHFKGPEYAELKMALTHFKWSPDGRRLFFLLDNVRLRPGTGAGGTVIKDLYIVNRDGTGLRQVNAVRKHPAWTPDGERIMFWGISPTVRDARIMILDLEQDVSIHQPISKAHLPSHPSMSPDLRWVMADRRLQDDARLLMHLVDVKTGDNELLLDMRRPEWFEDGSRNATHAHPIWTADSRAVIFNSQPGRNSQVFLMEI